MVLSENNYKKQQKTEFMDFFITYRFLGLNAGKK